MITDDESTDGEFLPYGMRIQVVDMQNGHAKLARDRGYVSATCSRIVKVDGPHDPACQIEGLLYSIATQKREICSKISGLHNIETTLINDLERALRPIGGKTVQIRPKTLPGATEKGMMIIHQYFYN
jgi:hypothetical protein